MSSITSDDALRLEAEMLVQADSLREVEIGSLMYGASVAPETVELWINGMLQPATNVYTASQTVIVFVEPLQAGDTLRVTALPNLDQMA